MPASANAIRFPLITFMTACLCLALLPYGAIAPLTPAYVTEALQNYREEIPAALSGFITYMFQHQSFAHFASNMVPFAMLGLALENAIGRRNFAIFLGATGIGAALVQYLAAPLEALPVIGLSGVVMALLTLFLLAAPQCTLFSQTVGKFRFSARLWHLAAVIAFMQFQGFFLGGGVAGHDASAYMIHLGGALTGAGLWLFWLRRRIQAYKATPAGSLLFS